MHPHVKAAHKRARLEQRPRPQDDHEYVVWGRRFQPISIKGNADFLCEFAHSDMGVINNMVQCSLEYERDHYELDQYVPLVVRYVIEGLSELEEKTLGR